MIGIGLGWLYANATEWVVHKHLLHGRGRDRDSAWSFHWHEHHRASRRHGMLDEGYRRPLGARLDAQTKEALALGLAAAAHLPLAPVAPFFVGTVLFSAARYYVVHKRSHLDEAWAKEHLPWHWDHHMGPNQDANWCVTHPFMDHVMGTREPYLGTDAERESRPRREAAQRRAAEADARRVSQGDGREAA